MSETGRVYVWQVPVRICHWLNVALLAGLFATGLYIGWPRLSPGGEAWDHAVMGWTRYVHFACGYGFLAVLLFRLYWFFMGNDAAHNIFRFWRAESYRSAILHAEELMVADPHLKQELPREDQWARLWHSLFFLACAFMIFSGFALYGESNPHGWAAPLTHMGLAVFGTSAWMHYWHHVVAWFFPIFVVAHVYQVVRTDILARQGLVSSMITGYYLNWQRPDNDTPLPLRGTGRH